MGSAAVMNTGQEDIGSQPLVIVRRRRPSGDDEHHGGVWKIAYADFMTAMMAFFLVMWLVNAADKQTIVQVAAYFNPMRLTDRSATVKGLEDIEEIDAKKSGKKEGKDVGKDRQAPPTAKPNEASPETEPTKANDTAYSGAALTKDEAIFSDPMSALDKLAEEARAKSNSIAAMTQDDDTVRDPFDPAHRGFTKPPATVPASKPDSVDAAGQNKNQRAASQNDMSLTPQTAEADKASMKQRLEEESKILESEIKQALTGIAESYPEIEVKLTPDGVLVSVIDDADFGMFAVGSAEPRPELVLMMEKIASVIKSTSGSIIIRGHTDGRAYRTDKYDNWRLSSARAHMAYYMLLRGGIDEKRFTAIEGRADRDLKNSQDTGAAQNRRIDILIKGAER